MNHQHAAVAAIAELVTAHPHLAEDYSVDPVLAGVEDVEWSTIPGCPAGLPAVLRGLMHPDTARSAERVLGRVVMAGPMKISSVMPAVVPFLLRLAADPRVPCRGELFGLVLAAAALSEPTDPANAWDVAVSGPEDEHPERALCRAAFAANATWVAQLLADEELLTENPLRDDERACLLRAAGL
ncbi:hypothetical protein ACPA54_04335 [Uniformispora flossi]|uniref:hypothetical protein n=1 Tax=Uniformispora flossi TaxID=3390723 RepID=UPI003C2EB08F